MKPAVVKNSTYIRTLVKKIIIKILNGWSYKNIKYKNIFAKRYSPNWSEDVFVIKKIKNAVLWTYVIIDLNSEIIGTLYEKKLKKINQKRISIEKVIKRKGNKLYVK